MILTGQAIDEAWKQGDIIIDPFDIRHINPNSYNYHLAHSIIVTKFDAEGSPNYEELIVPVSGYLLRPSVLYLAATEEVIGSSKYVVTLLGRSSLGRLGLFLNITSDLGHAGSASHWTLELTVVQPLIVYPHMCVGQVAFWEQMGEVDQYRGRYYRDTGPVPNRDLRLLYLMDLGPQGVSK